MTGDEVKAAFRPTTGGAIKSGKEIRDLRRIRSKL